MSPSTRLSVAFLLGMSAVWAQCPDIQFVNGTTVNMLSSGVVNGLQRLATGSLTKHTYSRTSPYARTASTANAETQFLSCSTRPIVTPTPPANRPLLTSDLPGATSRNPLVTDLANNGTPVVLIAGAYYGFANQLFVAQLNPDGTTKTTAGAQTTYPVGLTPGSIVTGDINGDGKKDVIVLNGTSGAGTQDSYSVLLGNGDGTLQTAVTTSIAFTTGRAVLADFNGDSKLDLAITRYASPGGVGVLLGNGSGGFAAPVMYETGTFSLGIVADDFNGDSKLDLAMASSVGSYAILTGNGSGGFGTPAITTVAFKPSYVGAGDFDKDGKVDLVFADATRHTAHILKGNGNGTFVLVRNYGMTGQPNSILVTDFDWDGNLDIVNASGHPEAMSGAFRDAVDVLYGRGDTTFYAAATYPAGPNTQALAVADFDADGKMDIAAANYGAETVTMLLGITAGAFQNFSTITITGAAQISSLVAADVNGDGKPDLIVTGTTGVWVAFGSGNGNFQTPTKYTAGTSPIWVAAGDVNGDGKADIVVANNGSGADAGGLSVLLNNGSGLFSPATQLNLGGKPNRVLLVDLNADNKRDIVAVRGGTANSIADPGGFSILLGNGDGTFQAALPANAGQNPFALAVGDVDGDGKPDIVVAGKQSTSSSAVLLYTFLGTGQGTFAAPTTTAAGFGATDLLMGDFNSDTKQDLILAHCCGQTAPGFLVGNGNGTFKTEVSFPSADSPLGLASSDFNGDSKPDLAVAHGPSFGDGFVSVYLNISGQTLTPGPSITGPAAGTTLTSGTLTLTWGAVTGATKYKVEIGSTAGGADLFTQEVTTNTVTVNGLPTDGRVLYVQVSAFVTAYSAPTAITFRAVTIATPLRFVPVTPCRVMETRAIYNFEGRTGAFGPPALTSGETRTLVPPLSNICNIPSHAKAYVVNVTLIPTTNTANFVTVWPAGEARPSTWTVRSPDGQIVANSAIVKAGANGGVSVYTSDPADFLIDISGYYTDSTAVTGLAFYPMTPCRVIDTRILYRSPAGPFGPPSMTAQQTRRFRFPSTPYCSVPQAAAYSVTLTAVPPGPLAFLTTWPAGQAQPGVSTINSFAGRVLANSVIIPASADGSIDVFAYNDTDFLIDINGYYAPDNGQGLFYFPVTQCRASDSTVSGGIYANDTTRSLNIPAATGCSGIPATAKGYAINVTALPNGNPMPFITAYPTGQPRPGASILNAFQGQIVSNAAIVPAGTNGAIDIYTFTSTHVVVEVSGYFSR